MSKTQPRRTRSYEFEGSCAGEGVWSVSRHQLHRAAIGATVCGIVDGLWHSVMALDSRPHGRRRPAATTRGPQAMRWPAGVFAYGSDWRLG